MALGDRTLKRATWRPGGLPESSEESLARFTVQPSSGVDLQSGTAQSIEKDLANFALQPGSGMYLPSGTAQSIEKDLANFALQPGSGMYLPSGTAQSVEKDLASFTVRPGLGINPPSNTTNSLEQAVDRLTAQLDPRAIAEAVRGVMTETRTDGGIEPVVRNRLTRPQMAKLVGAGLLVAFATMLQMSVPKEFDPVAKVTGFAADIAALVAIFSVMGVVFRKNRSLNPAGTNGDLGPG